MGLRDGHPGLTSFEALTQQKQLCTASQVRHHLKLRLFHSPRHSRRTRMFAHITGGKRHRHVGGSSRRTSRLVCGPNVFKVGRQPSSNPHTLVDAFQSRRFASEVLRA